jgi:hypothetical protein
MKRVAIVGGGFSGAMLAARLAESGVACVLINATSDFGLGVAYSTPFEGHLLNVRSNRMTAIEGRPDDFVDWLAANRPELAAPSDFAPRKVYGDYVRARLAAVEAAHPGLIERRVAGVEAVTATGLTLSDGSAVSAGATVLCSGNPAPNAAGEPAGGRVIGDPWAPGALDRIEASDDIVIVGTGLTMVDMVQLLVARGWTGKATALSRRGLMPRPHNLLPDTPTPLPPEALSGPLSQRLKSVRELASKGCWRCVMEAYRPITADLWIAGRPGRARPDGPAPAAVVGRASPPHRRPHRARPGRPESAGAAERRRRTSGPGRERRRRGDGPLVSAGGREGGAPHRRLDDRLHRPGPFGGDRSADGAPDRQRAGPAGSVAAGSGARRLGAGSQRRRDAGRFVVRSGPSCPRGLLGDHRRPGYP